MYITPNINTMSNNFTIGISQSELSRFKRQINRITDEKTKELKKVVAKSGLNMRNEAFRKCPAHFSVLRNSIRHYTGQTGLSVRVGTTVYYAPYVEFGTKQRVNVPEELREYAIQFKTSKPGAMGGVPSRPFLYPAFKNEQERFISRIKEVMNHV